MKTSNVIHHINKFKEKIHMTILTDVRKKIWQNTTLLYDKNYKPTCVKCVKTMFYDLNKDKLINETE